MEEIEGRHYKLKRRTLFSRTPHRFNGVNISYNENGELSMEQNDKIRSLEIHTTQKGHASERAMVQYIVMNCPPYICAPTQLIAPDNADTSKDEFKPLKRSSIT